MKTYDLYDLDIAYPKHSIEINSVLIPINIDIADIKFLRNRELNIVIEDEMYYNHKKFKDLDSYRWHFKFINIKDKLFDGFSKNFLDYNGLESLEDLFLIFDEIDLRKLIDHISDKIIILLEEFRRRLGIMLKLEVKTPNINLKKSHDMPQNIKDYLTYPYGYAQLQMAIEYNPTIFFPENIGKSILDWSLREIELHMSYLTLKNRIETVEDKYQAKVSEDMMNDKK